MPENINKPCAVCQKPLTAFVGYMGCTNPACGCFAKHGLTREEDRAVEHAKRLLETAPNAFSSSLLGIACTGLMRLAGITIKPAPEPPLLREVADAAKVLRAAGARFHGDQPLTYPDDYADVRKKRDPDASR